MPLKVDEPSGKSVLALPTPITNVEKYLKAILDKLSGGEAKNLPGPITRTDRYLNGIYNQMGEGGSGGEGGGGSDVFVVTLRQIDDGENVTWVTSCTKEELMQAGASNKPILVIFGSFGTFGAKYVSDMTLYNEQGPGIQFETLMWSSLSDSWTFSIRKFAFLEDYRLAHMDRELGITISSGSAAYNSSDVTDIYGIWGYAN